MRGQLRLVQKWHVIVPTRLRGLRLAACGLPLVSRMAFRAYSSRQIPVKAASEALHRQQTRILVHTTRLLCKQEKKKMGGCAGSTLLANGSRREYTEPEHYYYTVSTAGVRDPGLLSCPQIIGR